MSWSIELAATLLTWVCARWAFPQMDMKNVFWIYPYGGGGLYKHSISFYFVSLLSWRGEDLYAAWHIWKMSPAEIFADYLLTRLSDSGSDWARAGFSHGPPTVLRPKERTHKGELWKKPSAIIYNPEALVKVLLWSYVVSMPLFYWLFSWMGCVPNRQSWLCRCISDSELKSCHSPHQTVWMYRKRVTVRLHLHWLIGFWTFFHMNRFEQSSIFCRNICCSPLPYRLIDVICHKTSHFWVVTQISNS